MLRKPLLISLLTLALVAGASPRARAAGWLGTPSSYEQAVQAMAAARWDEARRLIAAASASEGRVLWVRRLLSEHARAEARSGYEDHPRDPEQAALDPRLAVAHCYAHHNIFLFLRTQEVAPALVTEAAVRAEQIYRSWIGEAAQVDEGLRWAYAGLLHELGRGSDAEHFLARTAAGSSWQWSRGGPPAAAASRFELGFQMLLAYYHTARGDHDGALGFLEAAARREDPYVRAWAVESDDFYRLRDDPRFRRLFHLD